MMMAMGAKGSSADSRRMARGMSASGSRNFLTPEAAAGLGAVGSKLGGIMPLAGGFAAYEAWHKALDAANERQHVRTGAALAGIKPSELARAEKLAKETTKIAPNMSASEILELFKEGRSAVQKTEEMFHLIGPLAQAASVLKGMGVENANLADIVKGGESLGLMNDPKRFRAYLEGQVKAMQVMGKTITTEQIYEAAKYSKAAGATLSDEFLNTTFPSLMQEMHGSSAGDALSTLVKTIRGGGGATKGRHMLAKALAQVGLINPDQIDYAKGSREIMGFHGKAVGDDVLAKNPFQWAQMVNQHLESHGFASLEDKIAWTYKLPQTAGNVLRIMIQQQKTLENHAKLYKEAMSLSEAVAAQKNDPKATLKELTAAFEDLSAAVL